MSTPTGSAGLDRRARDQERPRPTRPARLVSSVVRIAGQHVGEAGRQAPRRLPGLIGVVRAGLRRLAAGRRGLGRGRRAGAARRDRARHARRRRGDGRPISEASRPAAEHGDVSAHSSASASAMSQGRRSIGAPLAQRLIVAQWRAGRAAEHGSWGQHVDGDAAPPGARRSRAGARARPRDRAPSAAMACAVGGRRLEARRSRPASAAAQPRTGAGRLAASPRLRLAACRPAPRCGAASPRTGPTAAGSTRSCRR